MNTIPSFTNRCRIHKAMTADTFLTELKRLLTVYPKAPLHLEGTDNVELSNMIWDSKNLTYCFDCAKCNDSVFTYDSFICSYCLDCDYPVESELCYESVDPFKAYNCSYLEYSANIRDSDYCYWCYNCNDLFGCVNLKGKSFCIFNRQFSEAEYREKVKEYKKWPPEKVLAEVDKLKLNFPLTQTIGAHNENSDYGNYVHYSKNSYMCFDAAHNENCGYLYDSFGSKTSYDMTYGGNKADFSYEIVDCPDIFNCNYSVFCRNCQDSSYLFNCFGVKDSLGCVWLRQKQYCILNRQFSKEEYERLSNMILSELKSKNPGWGDLLY